MSEPARYEAQGDGPLARVLRAVLAYVPENELQIVLAAVGEAKRRESELANELDDTREEWKFAEKDLKAAEARVAELERALPNPERLEEIARLLDLFDRVAELADDLLPGEKENYRAIDHTQMQDDLRAWARAAREALGARAGGHW